MDGSPHDWFEGRGPRRALIVFVDDATSRLLALGFFGSETTQAYMETLRAHLAAHGRPAAPCSDRYGVFRVNRKGSEDAPTQFTRALGTLDIEPIHASAPQAKGRVERANRTLQDRLVKEMRLRGIDGMEAANAYLPEFMADFNRRFAAAPREAEDAHRPVPHDAEEPDLILCEQATRKLSKNLTFQFERRECQLVGEGRGYRLRGAAVTVCKGFDGAVAVLPRAQAGVPRAGGGRGCGRRGGREGRAGPGGRGEGGTGGEAGLEAGAGPSVAAAVQAGGARRMRPHRRDGIRSGAAFPTVFPPPIFWSGTAPVERPWKTPFGRDSTARLAQALFSRLREPAKGTFLLCTKGDISALR